MTPAVGRLARRHQPPRRSRRHRPDEHRGASPRPTSASSPTGTWPSAWGGRTRRSATPTSWSSHADPGGLGRTPIAPAPEWGTEPLLAFTNPNTSTSGRNVLVSLYSMRRRTRRRPTSPWTTSSGPRSWHTVQGFQQLVDHYMPGTIPLNTKIDQGESDGPLLPDARGQPREPATRATRRCIAADGTEQQSRSGRRTS